jgi:ferric-dicitrate binding protein FerR (iron transport regulator)
MRIAALLLIVGPLATSAGAQGIISARAGFVTRMEGFVALPLGSDFKPARQLKDGQILSTLGQGRAEMTLTPGSYLLLEGYSQVRMVSTSLTAPVVDLLLGAETLRVSDLPNTVRAPITLIWHGQRITVTHPGSYRFEPGAKAIRVYVLKGAMNGRLRLPGDGHDLKSGWYQDLSSSGALSAAKKIGPDDLPSRVGVVNYTQGGVTLPFGVSRLPIRQLQSGQWISTMGNGRAELLLTPGIYLRLDNSSEARVVSTKVTAPAVELRRGTQALHVSPRKAPAPITLLWREQRIAVTRGGLYRFELRPDTLRVCVLKGKLRLPGSTTDLKSGRYVDLSPSGKPGPSAKFDKKHTDEFDRFNQTRAKALALRLRFPSSVVRVTRPQPPPEP